MFSAAFIPVFAAAPDGSGPWADSVVSVSQGKMKNGLDVPVIRSNPDATLGVAEGTIAEGTFFSLGFGGNIVLRFDNGIRTGVIVVESTNPGYPHEKASVEVSEDGVVWIPTGTVSQSGEVSLPEIVDCVEYVRITDVSKKEDFPDEIADGYDVDGVQATNTEACSSTNPTPTPSITTTPTQSVTPTPTQTPSTDSSSNSGGGSNNSQPTPCTAGKPGTPTITSIVKTSSTTVQLRWTGVSPVTTYAISYGTTAGSYQYGVPSTGNVTEFTVGGLDPNANYYFVVRGVNDCQPGDASGERSTGGGQVLGGATTGSGQVLGASTDVLGATGSMQVAVQYFAAFSAAIVSYLVYRNIRHAGR